SAAFKVEALSKSPAKFNEKQLLFWQGQAVAQLSETAFWQWVGDSIASLVPDHLRTLFVETIKPNVQFPAEVKSWALALFDELPEWNAAQQTIIQTAGQDYFQQALMALDKHGADAEKITTHVKETCGVRGRALFLPLRVALTGYEHGPDLAILLSLMDTKTIK